MRPFRLAAVLRARKAQEDVAKTAVVRARAEARESAERVRARERDLDARGLPAVDDANGYAVTLWARQNLAAAVGEATGVAAAAEATAGERIEELAEAAARRRAMELLAERHVTAERRAEESAEQKVLDELAGTAHLRERGTQ